jgi:RNA recognition motif-containing protein
MDHISSRSHGRRVSRQRPKCVFVSGQPWPTPAWALETLFSRVGAIRFVMVLQHPITGLGTGQAFVAFETPDAAARSVEMFDGIEFDGLIIAVRVVHLRLVPVVEAALRFG